MSLFAIADLHLSFSSNKPMDIYGPAWIRHAERVREAWLDLIKEEDTVIIAGDISWGLKLESAKADLDWIHRLPGKKVLLKGNHDPWWSSVTKLNQLYEGMFFLQNTYYPYEDYAICGSRGWICPGSREFGEHDEKIYKREFSRLQNSFEAAKRDGYQKFIGIMHYPPVNEKKQESGFTEIFDQHAVEKVVYGHLHGERKGGLQEGMPGKTVYFLVACDALNCTPLKIK